LLLTMEWNFFFLKKRVLIINYNLILELSKLIL